MGEPHLPPMALNVIAAIEVKLRVQQQAQLIEVSVYQRGYRAAHGPHSGPDLDPNRVRCADLRR